MEQTEAPQQVQKEAQSLEEIVHAVAPEAVVELGAEQRTLFSQDVYSRGALLVAGVVRPTSSAQLAPIVAALCAQGYAVIPRGGGMSYTGGYLALEENSVIIDGSALKRVLEINREDMYVTVESGCTWADLYQALQGSGLRTPYWGTLSGLIATVGGSLSQGSIFWGCGRYGMSADAVLGLEVVLADGSTLRTGASARAGDFAFFRNYGPDFSGVFLGDCGALGIKTQVTLRLVPELPARRYLSFAFAQGEQLVKASREIARRGLAMECFGFDPCLQRQRMRRASLTEDVRSLGGVVRAGRRWYHGLWDAVRVVVAGRRFMRDVQYSVHLIIEEASEAAARAAARQARAVCRSCGGRQLQNSIPKILRANPFGPLNSMIGSGGERWVPVHALVPNSTAVAAFGAVQQVIAAHQEDIDRLGIQIGCLFATVGHNCFVLEPVFFWPDALLELHRRTVTPEYLAHTGELPPGEEARAVVDTIRSAFIESFQRHGAVHLQIGKTYPYREALHRESWQLLRDLKKQLDPRQRMNPGSLGL